MARILLKEMAAKKEISLYRIHKLTKIAHKTLYRYANGHSTGIQLDDLDKLCAALKCSVGMLIEVEKVELSEE
jgi:DNA-binding Xre family transcriptional regulator